MTDSDWTHRLLEHRTAISDTLAFTHAEASNTCFSPDRGIFYTVHTASRRCYGESHDILALIITPICQPHRAQTKIILERGVTPCVKDVKRLLCPNCYYYTTDEILYNVKTHFGEYADVVRGFVRITVEVDGSQIYYIDYDIVNDTFSDMKPLKVLFHDELCDFNGEVFRDWQWEQGFTDYKFGDENVMLTDKFKLHEDGYRYTLATAYRGLPTVMRIKDRSDVLEFVGALPEPAQYEAQSAILNGKMYALLRGAQTNDFYISDDMGKTFRPIGKIDFNTTRPQLLTYRDKILVAVSKVGVQPNYVRDGRNNLLLLCGEGDQLSNYEKVFQVIDPFGIVYYDIVDYKGLLHVIWSSGDLYLDRNPQAKDLLWFARIGMLE
ncbi:MAG: hypothetical protein J6W81_06240 [Lentisphaeria bacterium]|nr:hypothetical protein [Lentisphaeria bacterium]